MNEVLLSMLKPTHPPTHTHNTLIREVNVTICWQWFIRKEPSKIRHYLVRLREINSASNEKFLCCCYTSSCSLSLSLSLYIYIYNIIHSLIPRLRGRGKKWPGYEAIIVYTLEQLSLLLPPIAPLSPSLSHLLSHPPVD